DLQTAGILSTSNGTVPAVDLPWDPVTNAAFGYMHANCGHCHNPAGIAGGLSMTLRVSLPDLAFANPAQTPLWLTTVDVDTTRFRMGLLKRIDLGNADNSAILVRMKLRDADQMPPIATEHIDTVGIDTVTAWVGAP